MTLSGQDILDSLKAKRTAIEAEYEEIDAEYQRIAEKKKKIDERLSALDIVIQEYSQIESIIEEVVEIQDPESVIEDEIRDVERTNEEDDSSFKLQSPVVKNSDGKKKRYNLPKKAREHFNELPPEYTKRDVNDLLLRVVPDIEEVNTNTLSGIMRNLVEEEPKLARIKTYASGKSVQVYEKI